MLIPTISYQGNCNDAITFYKDILGAEVRAIYYFRDAPPDHGMDESLPPDFVMHSEVVISDTLLYLTDGAATPVSSESFCLSLSFDTEEEVISLFNKIAKDGKVIEPPAKQWWAALYSYVTDPFGLSWMIMTNE
ncbi:MAG: VOC family protein [Defluviitaleaceae bacterium]|nr:VOC family protein [Defluviitaleaceae bacterium]